MQRKLVAALACRNNGTRLYGKPLQNLDVNRQFTILEYMIAWLSKIDAVDDIVLGISEGIDNEVFKDVAEKQHVNFIIGSEKDVLKRLIECCESASGTDILRLTTESPFTCFEYLEKGWGEHVSGDFDFTHLDNVPVGSGLEIISLAALRKSHLEGEDKHRSELCSLYIRENKELFRINSLVAPVNLQRMDIRLTVDYPEDLILCRAVYNEFIDSAPFIKVEKIIDFLDKNKVLKLLVEPYVADSLKQRQKINHPL